MFFTFVDDIMVVGVLTCCTLYYSKAAQMNVQCRELKFYKFEMGHNTTETTKNLCCMKDEGAVDHSTITRYFKKFYWSCKNLDDQARSDRPKTGF